MVVAGLPELGGLVTSGAGLELAARPGWTLHRVWSPDWWLQPDREVERVVKAVEAALKAEAGVPRVRVRRAAS